MQLTTFLEIYFATFLFGIIFCRIHFVAQTLSRPSQARSLEGKNKKNKKKTYQTPCADQLPTPSSALALVQVVGGGAVTAIVTVATPAFSLVLQSFGSIPHLAPPAACTQLPSSRAALAALECQSDLVNFMSPPRRHLDSRGWLCRSSQTPVEQPTYKCSTPVNCIFFAPQVSAPAVSLVLEQLHTVLRLKRSHFGWANVQQQLPVRGCRRFVPNKSQSRYHMQYQPGPPSAGGSHQFITTNTTQLGAAHLSFVTLPVTTLPCSSSEYLRTQRREKSLQTI